MAQDIDKIAINLNAFGQFLEGSASKILEAGLQSLVSVIVLRIQSGQDADGKPFSEYSDVKYNADIFSDLEGPSQSLSFIEKAIKEKKEVSYLDVRKSAGLNNRTHNYSFSGKMLDSIDVELLNQGDGTYKYIIKPKDNENFQKLIRNEERENEEILEQSEEELQNVTNDMTDQILDRFEQILNQ